MARYDIRRETFSTPRGVPVTIHVREGTNDHNTANASLSEDEYGLRDLHPSGLALDIGGYLGTVAIGLAVDNPALRVICVEPVPFNAALIRANITANGLDERITLVEGLAGASGKGLIRFGYKGNETDLHHAFVGNSTLATPETTYTALKVPSYNLADLTDEPVSFLKIDCEGGEYEFFANSDLSTVALIGGEWHHQTPDGEPKTRADVAALLPDFDVTFDGPVAGPGGFRAVRR